MLGILPRPNPPQPMSMFSWSTEVSPEWQSLKEVMREHQRAYEGRDPDMVVRYLDRDSGEIKWETSTADLAAELEAAVAIAAGAPLRCDVGELSPEREYACQRIENWTRACFHHFEAVYEGGVRSSLRWDEAHYAGLNGMIAGQVIHNPQSPFGFELRMVDPYNLFPIIGDNGAVVAVVYKATVPLYEVTRDFPQAAQLVPGARPTTLCTFQTLWWDGWYLAWVNGRHLHTGDMGYNPWIIKTMGGSPLRGRDETQHRWTRWYGKSFIHNAIPELKIETHYRNAGISEVGRSINPSTIHESDPEEGRSEVDLSEGKHSVLNPGSNFQVIPSTLQAPLYNTLYQDAQLKRQRTMLPSALTGELGAFGSLQTGQALQQAIQSAESKLFALMTCVSGFRKAVSRRMLEIKLMMGDDFDVLQQLAAEPETTRPMLTAQDIALATPSMLVWEHKHYLPQDRLMMTQILERLIPQGIISKKSALGPEWLHVDNPALEEDRVNVERLEQILMGIPGVLQWYAQHSMREADPFLAGLIERLQNASEEEQPRQGAGRGGPGASTRAANGADQARRDAQRQEA